MLEVRGEASVPRVKEVWFWRRGRITVQVLSGDTYLEAASSLLLPGIDLVQLNGYLDRPSASQAIREYRAALTNPAEP